jgi:hypothetical protein
VNKPDFGAPLIRRSQQCRDFLDGIVNLGFLAELHVFASKGAHPDEGNVGADKRRGMAAVVARPNVQHPQRVPLGGLPAVWCSGARSRSLSTNTQASWNMCSFGYSLTKKRLRL